MRGCWSFPGSHHEKHSLHASETLTPQSGVWPSRSEATRMPKVVNMDVIGIGALNYDRLYMVKNIAGGGEEERAHSVVEAPGGSAANTIAGLSRLGARTGFIGVVGTDREGDFILDDLKKEGVDTAGIKRAKGTTGAIIGFVDRRGERALYAYPGVNDTLEINKRHAAYVRSARYLHLSSFVGDKSRRAQKMLLRELQEPRISFSPGMLYAKKFRSIKSIIKGSSVVFLNREEIRLLTGRGYQDGAAELVGIGAHIVVVTLGSKGCYVADKEEVHLVKAYPSKVVDTTGAGDAFAAGFLYGLLEGRNIKLCAKIGNWVASRCIAKPGARDGLPYAKDLKKQAII